MKTYMMQRYGKKQSLSASESDMPVLQAHDVLVKIHAASVNLLDVKIKNGEFKPILPYKTPLTLGHDVAGVVTAVGSQVQQFKVGDEVYSRPADGRIGTFAEYIAVHEQDVALKPTNLTMLEAASVPLVGLTAWQALVEKAQLKKGQKVFIQAGSGGVGTIAIQLAKYLGAEVATTASAKNREWLEQLGADHVIDYKTQDFSQLLRDYDVVINSQDAVALKQSVATLKTGGQLISISGPPDQAYAKAAKLPWILKLVFGLLSYGIRKQVSQKHASYAFLFMRAQGEQLQQLAKVIEVGHIKPVIDRVFALDDINAAMDYVASGRAKGKVVIQVVQ